MPELPEVETTCRGIEKYILGAIFEQIKLHNANLRWRVNSSIVEEINGAKCLRVHRRAKYILLELLLHTGNVNFLMLHLGMSGTLRIDSVQQLIRKHDHFEIYFNNKILRLNDPRRFGSIHLIHLSNMQLVEQQHRLLKKLAPEPLSNDFNLFYLQRILANKRLKVKQLLMNNHYIVGVGNIYANEVLFLSNISPHRESNMLQDREIKKLLVNIKGVLQRAIECGGTTIKDFFNPDGKMGFFSQELNIYEKTKCDICQGTIKRDIINSRVSFWCTNCQK